MKVGYIRVSTAEQNEARQTVTSSDSLKAKTYNMEVFNVTIEKLAGQRVKIGKTSITMKDENGKTRGVVNSITKFKEAQPNQQMDYFGKLRAAGVWGSRIDGIMDGVIFDNNRLYFLYDLKPLEMYNKCFAGRPGFESEAQRAAERERIVENMKEFSTVIPCYFE